MRAPLHSLCTFKFLVAPPSPRATAKLDPRWRGEGLGRGAAEPPERRTGGPAQPPRRALPACASRLGSGLGLSGPFGDEIPRQPHPPGAAGREGGALEPGDCGLGAGCPAQGLAHSRAYGQWMH